MSPQEKGYPTPHEHNKQTTQIHKRFKVKVISFHFYIYFFYEQKEKKKSH